MRALHEGQALFLLCSASGGSVSNQQGFRSLSFLEENIINLGRYLQQCHLVREKGNQQLLFLKLKEYV